MQQSVVSNKVSEKQVGIKMKTEKRREKGNKLDKVHARGKQRAVKQGKAATNAKAVQEI